MKRFFTLILLLLTACAPAQTSMPDANPAYELERAKVEAEYYASQLTATAQAPILEVTRAAAALEMTVQVQNLQGTQTAIPLTSTAQSWTPTVTATPIVNVTGTIAVEQMNAEIETMRLETERRQNTNSALAVAPYFVGFFLLALVLFLGYVGVKRLSMMPTPIDQGTGKPQPMIDVIEGISWESDKFANGALVLKKKAIQALPAITAERQHQVTSQAQTVDLQSRIKRLPRELVQAQGQRLLEAPGQVSAGNDAGLFPLPAWELVKSWDRNRDMIPLGNSSTGLEYWNLMAYGHLAMFGRSGAGKSRQGERPLVAFLLAAGQRVIAIGKEVDFMPFMGHPNFVFVPVYDVTEREEAMKYYRVLEGAVNEKERRIREMAQRGVSLWQGERTFLVLAELGNTLVDMGSEYGDKTLRKTRSIVNEGRKAGLSLVFSSQRPKGFIDLTTQCGRVVFQVENDNEKGYALGYSGAKSLPDLSYGYFYRKFGSVKVAGGFEPSDEQIRDFIGSKFVPTLPHEEWVDAVVSDIAALPTQPTVGSLPEPEPTPEASDEMSRTEIERVVQLLSTGATPSAVVRAVFGVSGGGKFLRLNDKVKEIKSGLEGEMA